MTNLDNLFDDIRYHQRDEDDAMLKMSETIQEINKEVDELQKNLNFNLCDEWDGSLDHNCVYQTLMIKRGFVMDSNVTWHNKDDYDHRSGETWMESSDLCLFIAPDYCHVHVHCDQKEVEREVERFLR